MKIPFPSPRSWADLTANFDALQKILKTTSGIVTISWPGGTQTSDLLPIAHGLGVAPTRWGVTTNDPSLHANLVSVDNTNLNVQVGSETVKGVGNFGVVRWWASA